MIQNKYQPAAMQAAQATIATCAFFIVIAGCGRPSEDQSSVQSNSPDSETKSYATDQEEVIANLKNLEKLPNDFPPEPPVYPRANFDSGVSSSKANSQYYMIRFNTADTYDKVCTYYENQLKDESWELINHSEVKRDRDDAIVRFRMWEVRRENIRVMVIVYSNSKNSSFTEFSFDMTVTRN